MTSKAKEKFVIFAWLMVVSVVSILLLFWTWNNDIFNVLQIQDKTAFKTITYAFFAGMLGSVIYAFRGFYQSIVETDSSPKSFNFKWIFWYLIRPISGGILGFVVYALARAELVAFGLTTNISEQNNLMFFGTSFLAGFGFHDFAEFLSRKTKGLFNEKK